MAIRRSYIKCEVQFFQVTKKAILVKPRTGLIGSQWIPLSLCSENTIANSINFEWGSHVKIEVQEWKARQASLII